MELNYKQNRYQWLDFCKAIAIIAVIMDHAFFYNVYGNQTIHYFTAFSVTLFIFLEGFTSALSISKRSSVDFHYYLSKILKILVPFTVATLVYHLVNQAGSFSLLVFINSLLSFSASPPFYFVFFFIQLILVSGFLYSLFNNHPGWFQVFVLIIIGFVSYYFSNSTFMLDLWGGGAKLLGGSYLFAFSLGIAFYINIDSFSKRKSLILLLGISTILFLVFLKNKYFLLMFSNPPNAYLLVISLLLFGIIYPISKEILDHHPIAQKIASPILLIGKYSLYIYLYHLLFMQCGVTIANSMNIVHIKLLYRFWIMLFTILPPILIGVFFENVLPKFSWKKLDKLIQFVESDNEQSKELYKFIPMSFISKTLVLFLGWTLYLVAYWPGQFSPDVNDQWNQILTGRFIDWHPAFHTMIMWLITRFWLSPALINFMQILFASVVVGWTLMILQQKGFHKAIIWCLIAFMICSPVFGMFLITPWKDIPYSISILLLTTLIFFVVTSNGIWLKNTKNWTHFGVVCALVMLFRHNGILVGVVTVLSLLVIKNKCSKQILLALALCISIWFGIRYPLYNMIGVIKQENPGVELSMISLIGRHVIDNTPLTLQEESKINQILPLMEFKNYNCDIQNTLLFHPQMKLKALSKLELFKIALKLSLRKPETTLNHFICTSSYILTINNLTESLSWHYYEYPASEGNKWVNRAETWTPNLISSLISSNVKTSMRPTMDWLIWRAAFWLYYFIGSLLIYVVVVKNWKYTLMAIPLLSNTIPLIFLSAGQAPRYVFSTFLISLIWGTYFLYSSIRTIIKKRAFPRSLLRKQ